jgi:hypothetical protein
MRKSFVALLFRECKNGSTTGGFPLSWNVLILSAFSPSVSEDHQKKMSTPLSVHVRHGHLMLIDQGFLDSRSKKRKYVNIPWLSEENPKEFKIAIKYEINSIEKRSLPKQKGTPRMSASMLSMTRTRPQPETY